MLANLRYKIATRFPFFDGVHAPGRAYTKRETEILDKYEICTGHGGSYAVIMNRTPNKHGVVKCRNRRTNEVEYYTAEFVKQELARQEEVSRKFDVEQEEWERQYRLLCGK